MAKKSRPNNMSRPAALQNTKIRNNTECTGFFALMTKAAEIRAILENKEKSIMSAFCFCFKFLVKPLTINN